MQETLLNDPDNHGLGYPGLTFSVTLVMEFIDIVHLTKYAVSYIVKTSSHALTGWLLTPNSNLNGHQGLRRRRGTQYFLSTTPRSLTADTNAYINEVSADNQYSKGEEEKDDEDNSSYGGDEEPLAMMMVSFCTLVEGKSKGSSHPPLPSPREGPRCGPRLCGRWPAAFP